MCVWGLSFCARHHWWCAWWNIRHSCYSRLRQEMTYVTSVKSSHHSINRESIVEVLRADIEQGPSRLGVRAPVSKLVKTERRVAASSR